MQQNQTNSATAFSRRDLLRLAGLLAMPAGASTLGPEGREFQCQFRAKATVLMLGVPLLNRDNVGSGYLRVAEREEAGKRRLQLEFGAGSLPERAAGLNRLGIFEETIVASGDAIESARYFGFMTASNEKDLNEARTALKNGGSGNFTAIRGQIEQGQLRNKLLRIRDMAASNWAQRDQLTAQIRAQLADETRQDAQASTAALKDSPCSPFLYAVNCAMRNKAATCASRFVHNGQMHQLQTSRKNDAKTGHTELNGRILSEAGKELSAFRLWFETENPERGPLKFDFRPRSFLRLTFERV